MSGEPLSGVALWGAKLAGAAAGSAISVAYLLPAGRREAAARFLIGLVTGLVFGLPAGLAIAARLGLSEGLSPTETVLMGSAAASLCAWWGLGALSRFAARLFRDGRSAPGRAPPVANADAGGAGTAQAGRESQP